MLRTDLTGSNIFTDRNPSLPYLLIRTAAKAAAARVHCRGKITVLTANTSYISLMLSMHKAPHRYSKSPLGDLGVNRHTRTAGFKSSIAREFIPAGLEAWSVLKCSHCA